MKKFTQEQIDQIVNNLMEIQDVPGLVGAPEWDLTCETQLRWILNRLEFPDEVNLSVMRYPVDFLPIEGDSKHYPVTAFRRRVGPYSASDEVEAVVKDITSEVRDDLLVLAGREQPYHFWFSVYRIYRSIETGEPCWILRYAKKVIGD